MFSSFMQYNEILVTGGTGRPGPHICRALIHRGFLPRLLVRRGSEAKIPPDVRSRCRVTPGDVTNRESVSMGVQGTRGIVHLAGTWTEQPGSGSTLRESHIHAAANLVYAASLWRVDRLIYVSAAGAGPGAPVSCLDAKGRAGELVRGSDRAWTIFRPAPWYDPVTGHPRGSNEDLARLANAVAEAFTREDAVRRVYEAAALGFPEDHRPRDAANREVA
jgi:uncharacterized protein YbjT (DUF2867 family)